MRSPRSCTARSPSGAGSRGRSVIGDTHELRIALVDLVDSEPRATEHDRLRWLSGADLDDVDWLAPDRPFLPELRLHLERMTP